MRQLFAEQLALCEAACDEVRAFFVDAGLGPETQDAAAEEEDEKDELPCASVEDVD